MATNAVNSYPANDWTQVARFYECWDDPPAAGHGLGLPPRPSGTQGSALVSGYCRAMKTVVGHLLESGLSEFLFARQSLYFLKVSNVDIDPRGLHFAPGESEPVRLTFEDRFYLPVDRPAPGPNSKFWTHDYSAATVVGGVHRFMDRIGWFQRGHPAMLKSAVLLSAQVERL
jgi:hypothetical protein